MTAHDAWVRRTPFEVGIPGREFADRIFGEIGEEAETRERDTTDPGAFILLGQVGRALREIQGEEDRGGEAFHRFGAFFFHAYHFHRAGEPLLLLETLAARYLVEGDPTFEGWAGELPGEAGYLQLPRHLFWSHPGGEDAPAEPLDGIFWTRSAGETLSLLVVLGVRGDRPGLSVMELPPVPLSDARSWVRERVREAGRDFETDLPGGELDRLYSVRTLGEALKLAGRALAYVVTVPEALGEEERPPHPTDVDEDDPAPSFLSFRRIRLVSDAGAEGALGPEEGGAAEHDDGGSG